MGNRYYPVLKTASVMRLVNVQCISMIPVLIVRHAVTLILIRMEMSIQHQAIVAHSIMIRHMLLLAAGNHGWLIRVGMFRNLLRESRDVNRIRVLVMAVCMTAMGT